MIVSEREGSLHVYMFTSQYFSKILFKPTIYETVDLTEILKRNLFSRGFTLSHKDCNLNLKTAIQKKKRKKEKPFNFRSDFKKSSEAKIFIF